MVNFHSLNARNNSVMPWIYGDIAKSDPSEFREAMVLEGENFRAMLASKNVNYDHLKSALTPTRDGRQVVFLYDWFEDESLNYAVSMADAYLPSLRRDLRTSVFQGDLLRNGLPVEALERALTRAHDREVEWRTQFAVYFSNIRDGDVEAIDHALRSRRRYTGYIDVSFASEVRDYLAYTLPSLWVIAGNTVLLAHGGDDPFIDSQDPIGFDLPSHGYEVVSLVDTYFVTFLDYKIEARNAEGSDVDRFLCLAAATGEAVDIETVEVHVPPPKLKEYLLREPNKLRLMTSIGLQDVTPDELARTIREKLLQSYIYDFRVAPDGTPLFAVSAEFESVDGRGARRLIALKYDATNASINLVSMY